MVVRTDALVHVDSSVLKIRACRKCPTDIGLANQSTQMPRWTGPYRELFLRRGSRATPAFPLRKTTSTTSTMSLEEKLEKIRSPKLQNQHQVIKFPYAATQQSTQSDCESRPRLFSPQSRTPFEIRRQRPRQQVILLPYWPSFDKQYLLPA